MPRRLLLRRRGPPPTPTMAVLHHRLQPRRGRPQEVPPHFPRRDGLEAAVSQGVCLDRNACALANPCNFSLEVFGSGASWPGQPSAVHPRSSAGTLTAIPAPCCPAHRPLFSQPPAGPLLRLQITCRGLSTGWVY